MLLLVDLDVYCCLGRQLSLHIWADIATFLWHHQELYSLLMRYKSLSMFILQSDQVNNRLQSDLNETKRKLEKAQDEIKEKMKLETNLLLAQSVSVQCDKDVLEVLWLIH